MASIAALGDAAVNGEWGTVGIDHVGAVVLVVALAVVAGQVGADLGADANTIANLDAGGAAIADLEDLADDLVADAERERGIAPPTSDGVHI